MREQRCPHGLPPGVSVPLSPTNTPVVEGDKLLEVQETAKRMLQAKLAGALLPTDPTGFISLHSQE